MDLSNRGNEVGSDKCKPSPLPLFGDLSSSRGVIVLVECLVVRDTGIEAKMGHQSGAVFMAGPLTWNASCCRML